MLRMLHVEVLHIFQCADIKQVSCSFQFMARKGARSLTELDCKKQFDNINPRVVLQAFEEASNCLYKKRRWRQT